MKLNWEHIHTELKWTLAAIKHDTCWNELKHAFANINELLPEQNRNALVLNWNEHTSNKSTVTTITKINHSHQLSAPRIELRNKITGRSSYANLLITQEQQPCLRGGPFLLSKGERLQKIQL